MQIDTRRKVTELPLLSCPPLTYIITSRVLQHCPGLGPLEFLSMQFSDTPANIVSAPFVMLFIKCRDGEQGA